MDAGAPAPEGLELPDGLLEAIQLHLNLSVLAVLWTAFILPAIATSLHFALMATAEEEAEDDEAYEFDCLGGVLALGRRRRYPANRRFVPRPPPAAEFLDDWDNTRYRQELHVSREIFDEVVEACESRLRMRGNRGLSVREQVLVAFCFLAGGGSYQALARQANRGKATVCRCVARVCCAIVHELSHRVPGPPTDKGEMATVVAAFERMGRSGNTKGIPNIFGCLDGTHIRVKRFAKAGHTYYNYKGYNSVLAHVAVDHRGFIFDVLVGYGGRNNDNVQLRSTQLWNDMDEGSPLHSRLWEWGMPINGVEAPLFLLCDSGYELGTFIIVPFKEPELARSADRARRSKFNVKLAKTRVVVEHAFGKLKNRFRALLKELELAERNVHHVILACVILHNMCVEALEAEPERDSTYHMLRRDYEEWNAGREGGGAEAGAGAAPRVRGGSAAKGAAMREAIVTVVNSPVGGQ